MTTQVVSDIFNMVSKFDWEQLKRILELLAKLDLDKVEAILKVMVAFL